VQQVVLLQPASYAVAHDGAPALVEYPSEQVYAAVALPAKAAKHNIFWQKVFIPATGPLEVRGVVKSPKEY